MDNDAADTPVDTSDGWVFRKPTEEIDETWVHGFLVGGIASATDDLELARAYAEAAAHLVSSAQEAGDAGEPWRRSHPILYLYRHALELYLKAIVRPARLDHRLDPLIDEFERLLQQRFGSGIPDRLRPDLLVLARVDPGATGFRYTHIRTGEQQWLPGEYWVSLHDLHTFASEVFALFEDVLRRLRPPNAQDASASWTRASAGRSAPASGAGSGR